MSDILLDITMILMLAFLIFMVYATIRWGDSTTDEAPKNKKNKNLRIEIE